MKKLFVLTMIFAVTLAVSGGVSAVAVAENINTSLERGEGGGSDPIVKAKWEMIGPSFTNPDPLDYVPQTYEGLDDDLNTKGAQFFPPEQFETYMDYTVCAIVTDPNGVDDIDGVYADIYYPEDVAFHPEGSPADQINGGPVPATSNPTLPDNHQGDANSPAYDYGINGCGAFIEENTLIQLTKQEGIDLFCDSVQNGNNNLPTFFGIYDYYEICGATGELEKETAYVYCDDKQLWYEDPAGDYLVEIFAQDHAGNFSYVNDTGDILGSPNPQQNQFEYLPVTAYEVDFSAIDYGQVLLNVHKRVSGDLTFSAGDGKPSVRNIGNTRLYMGVEQDDMGLGQTSGQWNVEYDARVGNETADWRYYWPEVTQSLEDILDLSETEEMDFSILITKYPNTNGFFSGDMYLSATPAEFRQCEN